MKYSNSPSSSCVVSTNSALGLIFCVEISSPPSSLSVYTAFSSSSDLPWTHQIIKGRETGRFTFEVLLLLALLSNFHKSDAAKLNPFLRHIGEITDVEVLRKVCWATEFTAATTVG